jgi:6-pyruvoyltetrahydropterin/6-carboxytetrahydropterin synthase
MNKSTVSAIVLFKFCAAHRLKDHDGDCFNLHGHNYEVHVSLRTPAVGVKDNGMVIDFGEAKRRIRKWIDERWDHAFLYQSGDTFATEVVELFHKHAAESGRRGKFFAMPFPPTAENMAMLLLEHALPKLFDDSVVVESVCVVESPTAWATARLSGESSGAVPVAYGTTAERIG